MLVGNSLSSRYYSKTKYYTTASNRITNLRTNKQIDAYEVITFGDVSKTPKGVAQIGLISVLGKVHVKKISVLGWTSHKDHGVVVSPMSAEAHALYQAYEKSVALY